MEKKWCFNVWQLLLLLLALLGGGYLLGFKFGPPDKSGGPAPDVAGYICEAAGNNNNCATNSAGAIVPVAGTWQAQLSGGSLPTPVVTTAASADGYFSFTGIGAGTYVLEVLSPPSGARYDLDDTAWPTPPTTPSRASITLTTAQPRPLIANFVYGP